MTSPNQVHFVQCFYDEVRIPLGNIGGQIKDGWKRRDVHVGLRNAARRRSAIKIRYATWSKR